MATFVGGIRGVNVKTIIEKEEGVIVNTYPELVVALSSASCDPDEMRGVIAQMIGKSCKVTIILEQGELDV